MPINVLFIVPSLKRAGAETQLVALINSLDNKKFNKHLFCFESELDLKCCIDNENVDFSHKPRQYKFDFSIVNTIADIINNNNIDIVYSSLNIALLMGWLGVLRSKHSPKIVHAIHLTINRNIKSEVFDKIIYQWLMRRCSQVIFVCNNQMKYWIHKYPFLHRKSLVVHNGVDTSVYDPKKYISDRVKFLSAHGIDNDAVIIACIAAFRPEKAHIILLKAFSRFITEHKNSYLLLAGDGPEKDKIVACIEKLNLHKNVKLLGSIDNIKPILASSDMSILASTAVETFSMAMLESLSMGVPVVATDIGGANEAIVPGKTGYLVKPGSSDDLCKGISEVLNLIKTRGKENVSTMCRDIVLNNYTEDNMVKRTEALLNRIYETKEL